VRLVYLAIDYALCVAWVAFLAVLTLTDGHWRIAGTVFALVWAMWSAGTRREFLRTLAERRRGGSCRPVSRAEWAILTLQLLAVLVIVLGLVP
jgi:hypothetical protein